MNGLVKLVDENNFITRTYREETGNYRYIVKTINNDILYGIIYDSENDTVRIVRNITKSKIDEILRYYSESNVKSLLYFDETPIKDECSRISWTSFNLPTVSKNNAKYGRSLQLNGTNCIFSDRSINMGGSNFTIDFWAYINSNVLPNTPIFSCAIDRGININKCNGAVYLNTGNNLNSLIIGAYEVDGTPIIDNIEITIPTENIPTLNNLLHYAIVYNNNDTTLSYYCDGVLIYSNDNVYIKREPRYFSIGGAPYSSNYFIGSIDDFRFTNNVARSVEQFIPSPRYDFKELEDYTWAEIAAIGAAGTGANYFDIGDTKTITLNGTVGTLDLIDYQCKVFIIDFNYRNDNGIYFQGFKDMNGVDIGLANNYNGSAYDGTKIFNMNHWGMERSSSYFNPNYGGWKGCDLRYDILGSTDQAPSDYGSTPTTSRVGYDATPTAKTNPVSNTLMAALPIDLRSALAAWTIYTDNTGNSSNMSANVTTSVDYLPLLAEFEVQGARSWANQYESSNQSQMTYYANGNSKIKYRHDSVSSNCHWWLRSSFCSNNSSFCIVYYTDGRAGTNGSMYSLCLAPAFRVA